MDTWRVEAMRRFALAGCVLATVSLAAQTCPEEPALLNYSGTSWASVLGFVAGDQGGAVFEAPLADYPVEILRVGIGWGPVGSLQMREVSINIYNGVPPNPGAPIAVLSGTVIPSTVLNEFDFESQPGEVVIASGPFLVSLTFLQDPDPLIGPSLMRDDAGCIGGQNYVSLGGPWQDLCSLGANGNWVMHVVYRPVICGEFKRGECNNDGGIDIADAIFTLSLLFTAGTGPAACADACDANNDGTVNIADAIALLSSLFGAPSVPLPAPYPDCGVDPGTDALDCAAYGSCP
ncbi:MAG: hypothetical protein ACKVX7_05700 [Planctomycetota bacterium]